MDTNEVARPDIERMAADDNSLSAHGVRILASAERDRRALLDYVRSLERELRRTLRELIIARNEANDPASYGLYEENLRATENRLHGLLEREAQGGGEHGE